ncbi:MAG: outer membrane beta-barrel protein [Gemmatimonadales bacterium]
MRFVPWILAGLVAASPTTLSAQTAGSVEVSALGVWHTKTVTMGLLRGFGIGGRLGVWLPANFGIEGQLDFTSAEGSNGNRAQLMYYGGSVLYNVPFDMGSVYLRGGYGRLSPRNCILQNAPCPSHSALSGGLGFRLAVTPTIQFRAEGMLRNRSAYDYSAVGAAAGITVLPRLGGRGASNGGTDTDRDGVSDGRDRCPSTPLGALVDDRGCPTDADRDGVPDGIDRCPATPPGTPVNLLGCPVERRDPESAEDPSGIKD